MNQYRISDSTLLPFFDSLRNIIETKDSANVFFFPYAGKNYRISQFVEWYWRHYEQRITIIDLYSRQVEDSDDLQRLWVQPNIPVIIFTNVLSNDYLKLASSLELWFLKSKVFGLVVHEDYPIFNDQINPQFSYKNNIIYHLPKLKEVREFAGNLIKDWRISSITPKDICDIYAKTGGYLWLVKEILRQKRHNQSLSVSELVKQPEVISKARKIWLSFPFQIRSMLQQQICGEKFLDKFGVINEAIEPSFEGLINELKLDNNVSENGLPELLKLVCNEDVEQKLEVINSRILRNSVDITNMFSNRQSQVLRFFLSSIGRLVSREEIARCYWQGNWEKNYSDWAIDTMIARLRIQITKIKLPICIQTITKMGYVVTKK